MCRKRRCFVGDRIKNSWFLAHRSNTGTVFRKRGTVGVLSLIEAAAQINDLIRTRASGVPLSLSLLHVINTQVPIVQPSIYLEGYLPTDKQITTPRIVTFERKEEQKYAGRCNYFASSLYISLPMPRTGL